MTATYSLEMPATTEMLTAARMFVATTARLLGWDEVVLDDLKLATSEAAASFMHLDGPIRTTISGDESRLEVTVFAAGEPVSDSEPGLVLGLEFVEALLGDVAVAAVDGGSEIRFAVAGPT